MNGDMGYALQKLELTAIDLATGKGDVRSRLSSVYINHLHVLNKNDFPEPLRSEWNSIIKALNKKDPVIGPDGEIFTGSVDNTLRSMKNKTGSSIASQLLVLRDNLQGYINDLQQNP